MILPPALILAVHLVMPVADSVPVLNVDPRRAARFHFGKVPFEYDMDEVLRDRTALDRPPTRFDFDQTDSLFFFRLPSLLLGMLRGAAASAAREGDVVDVRRRRADDDADGEIQCVDDDDGELGL